MKIIFLDIDGVLNTRRGWSNRPPNWEYGVDLELYGKIVSILEDYLITNPGVKIVLSSTWRQTMTPDHVPLGWKHRISKESLIIFNRIIDVTPWLPRQSRGQEIQEWLNVHPEVTQYAIIDDDSNMLPEQLPHFVHTDGSIGLTNKHIEQLDKILKGV